MNVTVCSPSSFGYGRTTMAMNRQTWKGMAGLSSAAAAATTTREGEKSNLLYEGFVKLGAPLTVVLVCFVQGVVDIYIGRKTLHIHVN